MSDMMDDDPICAMCGHSVYVREGDEFNEGDLCHDCLHREYPKIKQVAETAIAALRNVWFYDFTGLIGHNAHKGTPTRESVINNFCSHTGIPREFFDAYIGKDGAV